jgi:hypothetical protein
MHTWLAPRSFAFSSLEGSTCFLVSHDLLEVCPLSRWSNVSTPIRSITERLWLAPAILCPPFQQSILRYDLPPKGRNIGFTVFRSGNINDLAPAFTSAAWLVRVPRFKSEATGCLPFGSSLISIFGLLNLTMLAAVHLHWACHRA